MAESLRLVKPTTEFAHAFLAWSKEEVVADPRMLGVMPCCLQQVEELIRCCEAQELVGDPDTCGVPQTTYWLVRDNSDVVGSSRLRHTLTPQLENIGGQVDYGVRSSERRKGYGTRQLALLMDEARGLGLERLLVICRKDNEGSIKVILSNGGVLDSETINPATGRVMLRYWIDLRY